MNYIPLILGSSSPYKGGCIRYDYDGNLIHSNSSYIYAFFDNTNTTISHSGNIYYTNSDNENVKIGEYHFNSNTSEFTITSSSFYILGEFDNMDKAQEELINSIKYMDLWIPAKDYQLSHSQSKELHKTVANIADYIRGLGYGPSEEKYRILSQYGIDVINKYIDISTLSDRALKAIISENGYAYIVDVLNFTTEQLRGFVYFLPLIAALKGTLPGLELILSIFCRDVKIIEGWTTTSPELPMYTMEIDLEIVNTGIMADTSEMIIEFCSEYVYPLLKKLLITVSFIDGFTNKIFVKVDMKNCITLIPINMEEKLTVGKVDVMYVEDLERVLISEFDS